MKWVSHNLNTLWIKQSAESVLQRSYFHKFRKFTEKHLRWSLFLNKVVSCRSATLLKNENSAQVFSSEFGVKRESSTVVFLRILWIFSVYLLIEYLCTCAFWIWVVHSSVKSLKLPIVEKRANVNPFSENQPDKANFWYVGILPF